MIKTPELYEYIRLDNVSKVQEYIDQFDNEANKLTLDKLQNLLAYAIDWKKLDIDINLLCDVAKLGSGNSGALDRIASKALQGDFKGYVFSVDNTLKDLTYINDLLKDSNNGEELSNIAKNFYKSAKEKGFGNLLVSELINKEY